MPTNNILHFDQKKRIKKEVLPQYRDTGTKVSNLIDLDKKKYHFYRFPNENIWYMENFLEELSNTKSINIINNIPDEILLSSILEIKNNPQLAITLDELIRLIDEYPEQITDPEKWIMEFLWKYNVTYDITVYEHQTLHRFIDNKNYQAYMPDQLIIDMNISIYHCEILNVNNDEIETSSDIQDFQKQSIVTVLDFIIAAINNMILLWWNNWNFKIRVIENQLHQTSITLLDYNTLKKIIDNAYERYKWNTKNMTLSYEEYIKSTILSKLIHENDIADNE